MRILLADPDGQRRRRAAERLAALPGLTVCDICADLTETFNAVEHRPPNLVILAPELVQRPEFEMMEILFRTLSVRWVAIAGRSGQVGLDLDADAATLAAALHDRPGATRAAAPGASTCGTRSSCARRSA